MSFATNMLRRSRSGRPFHLITKILEDHEAILYETFFFVTFVVLRAFVVGCR